MTKLFQSLTLLSVALFLHSCGEDIKQPSEVEFTIDYSFSSGSMSRATNDEVYTNFFNDYIKTRKITPNHFSVSFINSETKQKTEITGLWTEKSFVKLLEGNYTVSGNSINKSSTYKYVRDSLALSFNDNISINSKTTDLKIKAEYNCALIFFDTSKTTKVRYANDDYYNKTDEPLNILNGYFYGFVHSFSGDNSYIEVTRKYDKAVKIYTKNLNLENGKYYFFNDMTGGFDLEPMTPGN